MVVEVQEGSELAELMKKAAAGEEVLLARPGEPTMKLVAVEERTGGVRLGTAKGMFTIPDEFYEPWPEEMFNSPIEPHEDPA